MYICIDFDGTCVGHEFPDIGKDIGAIPVLKRLVENGHKLILFTMRSNMKDVKSEDYNIHSQSGDYLDDAALGAPLKFDINISERPFIDWEKVNEMLIAENII